MVVTCLNAFLLLTSKYIGFLLEVRRICLLFYGDVEQWFINLEPAPSRGRFRFSRGQKRSEGDIGVLGRGAPKKNSVPVKNMVVVKYSIV